MSREQESGNDRRAEEVFRADPEGALRGETLASLETDRGADRSKAIVELADDRERFVELVSALPETIQDCLLQYYLLGRTQTQIGVVMGWSQQTVCRKMQIGERALCAVIAGGRGRDDERLMKAFRECEVFRGRVSDLALRTNTRLGEFRVRTDERLDEWLVGGC